MTTLKDIFKKSFLEGYASADISASSVIMALAITAVISLYVFLIYRVVTRKTFYSKNFNISLVGVAMITTAIIVTIQSSVVVSLGMVGALSIVRFRTAIKDPMDLMFLFWSISTGIICGAGFAEFAVILALAITIILLILENYPAAKAPMILIINAAAGLDESAVEGAIKQYAKHYQIKARNLTATTCDMTIELRTNDGGKLVQDVMKLEGVQHASLLEHDGEATF